jgi:hypothetical protein
MKDHFHAWNVTNLVRAVMVMVLICVKNVQMDMSYVMECAQVNLNLLKNIPMKKISNFCPLTTDLTNEKRENYVNFTRYCLYFGLCVTVCIIFQNSTWLAAIFGIIVGVYISLSEYWLKTNPAPKPPVQKLFESAMEMH